MRPGTGKTILCYGDSNTWGFSPVNGLRFPKDVRWPGVLAGCLGDRARVVEDGLNGRTLCSFYVEGDPLNGSEHVLSVLTALKEVQILILYLGINDLFASYQMSAGVIADEMQRVVRTILDRYALQLVLVAPLPVNSSVAGDGRELVESKGLAPLFKNIAADETCLFFDPATVIAASKIDGVHIDAENHVALGQALCRFVHPYC